MSTFSQEPSFRQPLQSIQSQKAPELMRRADNRSDRSESVIESPIPTPRPNHYTILIVDDSTTDRVIYQRYINSSNMMSCSIIEADCGDAGLEMCQEHSPDLVLLDYMLPDLDGLEFLQALHETMSPLPPVIMLTGEGNEKVAVEAMKIGVRDYLVKNDLNADRFSQAVQRVLSQQALKNLVDRQQRQQRLMASIALRVSRAVSLEETLHTATEGILQLLDCDRTVIYRFNADCSGTIVAESLLPGWTVSLNMQIKDTCLESNISVEKYLDGHKTIIGDIHNSYLTPCHINMLEQFQVKANLVVPIVLNHPETQKKKVWGLLLAHHCRTTREWRNDELRLLDDLSVQLAIAIQQSEFVTTLKSKAESLSSSNRRLVRATKLLKERNKELDDFAYIASHDLRAPLRAITNLASWLEEDISDKIPEESKEQLQLIRSRAKRLDEFIKGLLDYSRAGRQHLEKQPVDVHHLITEVIDSLSPPATLTITQPVGSSPTLETYKLLLHQVLSNLIGNAVKYHDKENGTIQITVQERGEHLSISVTDNGPGIDPMHHQKIFGIFQTLSSRDEIESTGIGLSIVKKIIEQQKGKISLESSVGEGSTFTFTWPKA
ncbi:MAG: ATP-binding protein [Cyanobacteria bacterium J06634_5]